MALLTNPTLSGAPEWSLYDTTETNQEHDLFESHVVEACDIYGTVIYYYPVNPDFDPVYGEDQNKQYYGPCVTKAIYKPGVEPTLYNTFGMLSDEVIERMQMPKFTFSRDVTGAPTPEAGDVIRTPWNKNYGTNYEMIYEVADVSEEDNTFFNKKFSWEFILKPYRAGEESNVVDDSGVVDSLPISGFGENIDIETEGDIIDDYTGLPNIEDLYGYK